MLKLVLWIDDLRNPPNRPDEQYLVARSVNDAKTLIEVSEQEWFAPIDYISIDHDAGEYAAAGGDFINVLKFLEYRQHTSGGQVPIHSSSPIPHPNLRKPLVFPFLILLPFPQYRIVLS